MQMSRGWEQKPKPAVYAAAPKDAESPREYMEKVKAMYDDTGARIDAAGPSTPVQVLGLNNAPQAGDKFNVMENEREAKELANKREQIQREQSIRTKKHITIDEIGR